MDEPRMVLLFSGHMIDADDRSRPRFPAGKEAIARNAIEGTLDALRAGAPDLGVCGGACGGDLLFAEAALARGMPLEICLPIDEAEFLAASVDFAGPRWRERYHAATRDPRSRLLTATAELGPLADGANAYERANAWMLSRAGRFGPERVQFVCLWNGEGGDGPGGTRHMVKQVERSGGTVHWLDTRELWQA